MSNQAPQFVKSVVGYLVVAIFYLIVMVQTVPAQSSGTPMRPPGVPDLKGETRRQEQRETMLRNTELSVAVEKKDAKRVEAAIEQIKQDFKQIQIVRNELVRNLLADKPMEYQLIADKAGNINKRADHLKTYLLPPDADGKEKTQKKQVEFKSEEMKGALVRLCNLIANFIDNPVLKNPGVTDVQQSAKAGGDLLNIIELSGNIKRSAERLNKVSK